MRSISKEEEEEEEKSKVEIEALGQTAERRRVRPEAYATLVRESCLSDREILLGPLGPGIREKKSPRNLALFETSESHKSGSLLLCTWHAPRFFQTARGPSEGPRKVVGPPAYRVVNLASSMISYGARPLPGARVGKTLSGVAQ